MNIFEIIASGGNGLNEVHISAILGWLIDPYHDHGLGMEVLKKLVSELFKDTPLHKEIKNSEYSGVEMEERYGRRRIVASVEMEKQVVSPVTNKERNIDIVINIENKFILAIENKIKSGSKEDGQVSDEISGLIDAEKKIASSEGIYFIYLVNKDKELEYADKELKNSPKSHKKSLSWVGTSLSMSKVLKDIISDNMQGKINPIPSETLFLLRSFIRFVENGFKYYQGKDDKPEQYFFKDLKTLKETEFASFMGGMKVLENTLKDQNEKERLIYKRRYKISKQPPSKNNWIMIKDLLACFKKHGILFD